ncbi:MAG: hypothetical protein ACYCWW_07915 [Deltaproteobacteria bacterium]
MGLSVWFFLRPRPGELRPLAQRAAEAFITDGGRLPVDGEGFVRYAQVTVRLEARHAVEVLRCGFFQYRALPDGTLDRDHFQQIMTAIPEAAFGWLELEIVKRPPGVVGAEHRFAKRRLEHLSHWKPTRRELAVLRELVNHKAGCEIMDPSGGPLT